MIDTDITDSERFEYWGEIYPRVRSNCSVIDCVSLGTDVPIYRVPSTEYRCLLALACIFKRNKSRHPETCSHETQQPSSGVILGEIASYQAWVLLVIHLNSVTEIFDV